MMNNIKTFQDLRDHYREEKYEIVEDLICNLHEMDDFSRGRFAGLLEAYDDVDQVLRNLLKYTDVE